METRARFILVGVFTVLSLLAALGFILWLAKVQLDRSYAQYDILFDTVAGLGQASPVQYNGVDVGKVTSIALDDADPALVRVRIEIDAATPVRTDTTATLSAQGVTGVSFVALEGGSASAERLEAPEPGSVPTIPSKPSVVQELITGAPDLLAEAISLMKEIRGFTSPENGAAIAAILENMRLATDRIGTLAARTEAMMGSVETTLAKADAALGEAQATFASGNAVIANDLPPLVARLRSAVDDVARTAAGLRDFTRDGLPQFTALAGDARDTVADIGALARRISTDPGRFFLGTQTPAYRR